MRILLLSSIKVEIFMINSNNICLNERVLKHEIYCLNLQAKYCYEYKWNTEKMQELIMRILDDSPHKTAKNVLTKIINNNKVADKIKLRLVEDDLEILVKMEFDFFK